MICSMDKKECNCKQDCRNRHPLQLVNAETIFNKSFIGGCNYRFLPSDELVIRKALQSTQREEKLVSALKAMLDEYEDVYDMYYPKPHQSEKAKEAQKMAKEALAEYTGEKR